MAREFQRFNYLQKGVKKNVKIKHLLVASYVDFHYI